jgi:hypothetical protein
MQTLARDAAIAVLPLEIVLPVRIASAIRTLEGERQAPFFQKEAGCLPGGGITSGN